MKPKRLLWQLYPSYLLITLISLAAVGWYAASSMEDFYYEQVSEDLKASADIIQQQVLELHQAGDLKSLRELSNSFSIAAQRRITIIEPSGRVIIDSQEDPAQMDDHSDRPEVLKAMKKQVGTEVRFSSTLGLNMMYVAIPVETESGIAAVLRIAKPVSAINSRLKSIYYEVLFASLIVAAAAAILSLVISRRISSPLVALKNGAKRFAAGDLTHKLPTANCQEIDAVARAMNQMASEIDRRIATISRQRNEHKAVLSSMSEALIAVDSTQKLITLNASAAKLTGTDISTAKGRALQEVIRNSDLQSFVTRSLASNEPQEDDITLYKEVSECYLQAKSSPLLDEQGLKIGILVVLNDVTRIRRLEKVRRDFVANVSHELKTPITSIKGFVETLLDGAIKKPEDAARFLEIIEKQTNRMDAIIDDLLVLSKIEQQSNKTQIKLESSRIIDALQEAVELCRSKADAKQIEIKLSCDEDISAQINLPLLEQAIVNLLDNAIKYSPSSSRVELSAVESDEFISVKVTDFGSGIESHFLPRLFERFFRVDKARSRTLGGTGLGLAIVKHIADAHRGFVEVMSTPGRGSVFTINLPK